MGWEERDLLIFERKIFRIVLNMKMGNGKVG
jgi:hypothetical protein